MFHFSDFVLSLHPVLHRELVILPSKHFTVGMRVGILNGPSEVSELIVDTENDEARVSRTSVQLREVLKVCQQCHNLSGTAKEPVVMSPAVQFRPVPLMKRMLVRVGQVNRLNRQ